MATTVLNDKDIMGIISLLKNHVDQWFISEVNSHRRMEVAQIEQALKENCSDNINVSKFDSIEDAYVQAQAIAHEGDRIIVFGSIFTVSEVLASES